jgi:hypothetical protein
VTAVLRAPAFVRCQAQSRLAHYPIEDEHSPYARMGEGRHPVFPGESLDTRKELEGVLDGARPLEA